MRRLAKDPFIHFVLLGAALFALLAWRSEPDTAGGQTVRVGAEQVEQIRESASLRYGRPPTPEELQTLVEAFVHDEVLYREARALGLDDNDDEVRRRLIDKMQYLTENLADPQPASEEELRAFFDAEPERFLIPEAVTFDQLYFSPRERGEGVGDAAAAALAALRGGASAEGLGDKTPLSARFTDAPRERISVLFGDAMTDAVFAAEPGVWVGPYESDFGLHLVRVVERREARQPVFDEVRDDVVEQFAQSRLDRANEAAYAAIRAHYDVIVDWPAGTSDDPTP